MAPQVTEMTASDVDSCVMPVGVFRWGWAC